MVLMEWKVMCCIGCGSRYFVVEFRSVGSSFDSNNSFNILESVLFLLYY